MIAHRQTADGVAVAVDLGDLLHMPGPKIREGGALVDAEQHLMGVHRIRQTVEPVMLHLAALEPAEGPLKESMDMIQFELDLARNSVMDPQTSNYGSCRYLRCKAL